MLDSILLLSGGIDSTVLLHELIAKDKKPLCLIFDYGQTLLKEVEVAKYFCNQNNVDYKVIKIDLSFLKSCSIINPNLKIDTGRNENEINSKRPKSYVAFRNGIFLSYAISLADELNIKEIYCGGNGLNSGLYYDDTEEFAKIMTSAAVSGTNKDIKILFPYCNLQKSSIVELGYMLNVEIYYTYSCYVGEENHCGKCDSCFQRSNAILKANINNDKNYYINEITYSIQGEGLNVGKPFIFIRFSGCNLKCDFCDTNHLPNKPMKLSEIIAEISQYKTQNISLCGGEPSLQINSNLINTLKTLGYYLQIETNGLKKIPKGIDHIVVSPKGNLVKVYNNFHYNKIHELRFVVTDSFNELISDNQFFAPLVGISENLILSPVFDDNKLNEESLKKILALIMVHPQIRLSVQMHKLIGIE
jgi:7-cyano-7-deazaguanine synthase